MSALNGQAGGNHYKDMPIGPSEYCQRNKAYISPMAAQIIIYASRLGRKGGVEGARIDCDKIIHFAEMIKEIDYPVE